MGLDVRGVRSLAKNLSTLVWYQGLISRVFSVPTTSAEGHERKSQNKKEIIDPSRTSAFQRNG